MFAACCFACVIVCLCRVCSFVYQLLTLFDLIACLFVHCLDCSTTQFECLNCIHCLSTGVCVVCLFVCVCALQGWLYT